MRRLIDLTRRILLAQAALIQHRETRGRAPVDAAADVARAALERSIAAALEGAARRTENAAAAEQIDLRTPLAALEAATPASKQGASPSLDGELALSEALVDRVEALQRVAGTA